MNAKMLQALLERELGWLPVLMILAIVGTGFALGFLMLYRILAATLSPARSARLGGFPLSNTIANGQGWLLSLLTRLRPYKRPKARRIRGIHVLYVAIGFFLTCWLMLGVYEDREFPDVRIFVKHRPTLKFFFRAPVGESDLQLEDLSSADRAEEEAFHEFIEEEGGYKRSF